MSLRKPRAQVCAAANYQWDAERRADKMAEHPLAASPCRWNTTIPCSTSLARILTGGGVTASDPGATLDREQDITVHQLAGGDMFGDRDHNLSAHPAKVTVEVLGWAASAASMLPWPVTTSAWGSAPS